MAVNIVHYRAEIIFIPFCNGHTEKVVSQYRTYSVQHPIHSEKETPQDPQQKTVAPAVAGYILNILKHRIADLSILPSTV